MASHSPLGNHKRRPKLSGELSREMPTLRGAITAALFSRGLSIVAAAAAVVFLPLVVDEHSLGQFFVAQLIIGGLATFGQLGFTFSIPAKVTEAMATGDLGTARNLVVSIAILSSGAGVLAAGVALLFLPNLAQWLGMADPSGWLTAVPVIAFIVPLTSLSLIIAELARALHAIRIAALLSAFPSVVTAGYLGILTAIGATATLTNILVVNLSGLSVSVVVGAALVTKAARTWRPNTAKSVGVFSLLKFTLPNLYTTLILFALINLDLLILTSLGSIGEVAQYGLALRICALLLVPLGIINSAFAPLCVQARANGEVQLLREMISKTALISGGFAIAGYLGLLAAGYPLILMWQSDYRTAYWLALILGLAKVFHACGGSAGILLMVWGDQIAASRLTLIVGLFSCTACILGYAFGGIFGLASASAVVESLQVSLFVGRVRTQFGIDPSLLKAIAR